MGSKNINTLLKILILFLIFLAFVTCGKFLGFSSTPEPDLGNIKTIRIFLSPDALFKLYNTVKNPTYVSCIYEEEEQRIEAAIKIRGLSTRIYPKKSFTIKIIKNNETIRYCLKDFSLKNRLAFSAYKMVGLGVPDTEGIALFINDEYIGCYTRIKIYNQQDLAQEYHDIPGQLFKCHFDNMGSDFPLHYLSEKKFPDNNDFSTLNELILNAKRLNPEEWNEWTDENIDKDEIIKYMVVHEFLGVTDTHYQNFYIYAHSVILLLPWDNELGIDINHLPPLGGNNILTKRLLEEPYMRNLYNLQMQEYFLYQGELNIVQDLINNLTYICQEIDRAVYYDPTFYITYDNFLQTAAKLETFLLTRPTTIPDPPLP